MNKLNEMDIADLSDNEIKQLLEYEGSMNRLHDGSELYLLVLKR